MRTLSISFPRRSRTRVVLLALSMLSALSAIAVVTPRMDDRGVAQCKTVLWIGAE